MIDYPPSSTILPEGERDDPRDARISELESKLDASTKAVLAQQAIIEEQQSRLDALSDAVQTAWFAKRETDMWGALGRAMDIVDPAREKQSQSVKNDSGDERHEHKLVDPSNEVVEAGEWRLCVECGYLQKPQSE